jgi:hypothetical protein
MGMERKTGRLTGLAESDSVSSAGRVEVGNVLKVFEIASEECQVMFQARCRNEDVQITDLLPDTPGKAAPNLGKAFHDRLRKGQNGFPFQKAS